MQVRMLDNRTTHWWYQGVPHEPKGCAWDPLVSPVSIPGCPTSEHSFPFIIMPKMMLKLEGNMYL